MKGFVYGFNNISWTKTTQITKLEISFNENFLSIDEMSSFNYINSFIVLHNFPGTCIAANGEVLDFNLKSLWSENYRDKDRKQVFFLKVWNRENEVIGFLKMTSLTSGDRENIEIINETMKILEVDTKNDEDYFYFSDIFYKEKFFTYFN